jgi:uncharacterized protein
MYPSIAIANLNEFAAPEAPRLSAVGQVSTQLLSTAEDAAEALTFLAARPLHTVNLRGLIADNGLESPFNRGQFYGCRDASGQLVGVALIGHATLMEARTDEVLAAFARLAQTHTQIHMVLSERESVARFWQYYAPAGQTMRLACRELLFEQRYPVAVRAAVPELRPATLADLELILPVQAEMAYEESGVNPLTVDPDGFRARCARRIARGRTWVWVEAGQLIFKADIMADTAETVYVEGIYVNAAARGRNIGTRCLSQLNHTLLQHTQSVCLLVNEQNRAAQAFYQCSGFKMRGHYDTIFLQQPADT